MSTRLTQRTGHPLRFLRQHQDPQFLHNKLQLFVAPFAPTSMAGAGVLLSLAIALQWLDQDPHPVPLIGTTLVTCIGSISMAQALRRAALSQRTGLACLIACAYISMLSGMVSVAFANLYGTATGALPFIAILAFSPVVFWLKLRHLVAGLASAFLPITIALWTTTATGADWKLLVSLIVFVSFLSVLGLFVSTACLYVIFEQNRALHSVSREDDLTGLYRRRYWSELALQQLHRLKAYNEPATLFYMDLDGFKEINDSLGHNVGDEVLVLTAAALLETVPANAITGRPGGDEFTALLPGLRVAEARGIATQLRETLAARTRSIGEVHASIGMAEWIPGDSLVDLVGRADQAMMSEKQEHRRRHAITTDDAPAVAAV